MVAGVSPRPADDVTAVVLHRLPPHAEPVPAAWVATTPEQALGNEY
jgi:hypothetical protein